MTNLQIMGKEIISAVEEERKRIARDVHDGPTQSLANIVLRIELIQRLFKKDTISGLEELEKLKGIVKDSLNEMRRLIFNLRPMSLDDLGLIPAIKKYIQDFQENFSINVHFINLGNEIKINSITEINLFRIVQEALNNVVKHADAKNIKLILDVKLDKIILNIKDDGRGFNILEKFSTNYRKSLGLVSMKERAELLNGSFSIKSNTSEGTSITVTVPV